MWFNEFLKALAELVRAAAWPIVALIVLWRHRTTVDDLLRRLRELLGAKFDPPQPPPQNATHPEGPIEQLQHIAVAAPNPPPVPAVGAATTLPPSILVLRTPVVVAFEEQILATSEFQQIQTAAVREQALLTVAAATLVLNRFERIEALIWNSQLDLLERLNSAVAPLHRDAIKAMFFDSAAARWPFLYQGHPYDAYLGYLASQNLIAVDANGNVTITEFGREYLIWRIRDGRSREGKWG